MYQRYMLTNKLLITYNMIFPTKQSNSIELIDGKYHVRDKDLTTSLVYDNGLLTAESEGKVIFLCHVESFTRFGNIWKL